MMSHHRYRSPWTRGLYSFALVAAIMAVGTIGLHRIEGMAYLDAFYLMSMIATAQGPASTPSTSAGKLFVALMAFVSVGSVVTALGFLLGPFFGQLWHLGVRHLEEDLHHLRKEPRHPGEGDAP